MRAFAMDGNSLEGLIVETVVKLLESAVTQLPDDVVRALEEARKRETSDLAKKQLEAILENVALAREGRIPICQDTGVMTFYVSVGDAFPFIGKIPRLIEEAVRRATEAIPLRPNAVDTFTGVNSGDNTGLQVPHINFEITEGSVLEITALPKGGGSENTSMLKMLSPIEGMMGVKKAVVDAVLEAGAKPCPPIILGVGLGGGADIAMKLAKKAVLRPLNRRHNNPEVVKLEDELLKLTNETGIGPMGLGGKTTVLGVNIEYAHRHPASLPVGIIMQCWAARRATAKIWSDGRVEYLT
ncbi:MAG: fumarate hydratase [Candidatus Geothermarchaeales archaeon]